MRSYYIYLFNIVTTNVVFPANYFPHTIFKKKKNVKTKQTGGFLKSKKRWLIILWKSVSPVFSKEKKAL